MSTARLEHVNISVTDVERTAHLLEKLCGWHRRWEGPSMGNGRTIHIGDDEAYVALYTNDTVAGGFAKGHPMNHIGVVVEDLAAAEATVAELGLEPFGHDDYEPGRRFYFFDTDGIEWEVVNYSAPAAA